MPAARILGLLAIALLTTLPLAGCQSQQLAECKKKTEFLEFRISEYKQRVEVLENDAKLQTLEIEELRKSLSSAQSRLSTMEAENVELKQKLAARLEGTKGMVEGLEELRRMQQQAAEKLRQQETEKAPEPTPPAAPQQ